MPAAAAMSSIETSSKGRSLNISTPSATSCSRRASVLRRARRGVAMSSQGSALAGLAPGLGETERPRQEREPDGDDDAEDGVRGRRQPRGAAARLALEEKVSACSAPERGRAGTPARSACGEGGR